MTTGRRRRRAETFLSQSGHSFDPPGIKGDRKIRIKRKKLKDLNELSVKLKLKEILSVKIIKAIGHSRHNLTT